MSKKLDLIWRVPVILAFAAAVIYLLNIAGWIDIGRVLLRGKQTTAVYSSFDTERFCRSIRLGGAYIDVYYIRLDYQDEHGKDYSVYWDSSYGFYSKYYYGRQVTIKYLPDDPSVILPEGELYHALVNYFGPAFVGLILLTSIVVIPIVFNMEKKCYGDDW